MKLTKYGHACVFVDNYSSKLIIDPGEFTELPSELNNVTAVICTHMHADHTYAPNLRKIVSANPDVRIYASSESLELLHDVGGQKIPVDTSKEVVVGEFTLSFYVNDHAVIWNTIPCENIAVKVDSFYYYAGDSFHTISDKMEIVGVPVSAPWLKMNEAIEFSRSMTATYFMPTHNGLLNEVGHNITTMWVENGLKDTGKELLILKNGESHEL